MNKMDNKNMFRNAFVTALLAVLSITAFAQTPNIRYVCNNSAEVKNYTDNTTLGYHVPGAYTNDGKSWAKAKNNIQDAINDLVNNGLTGEVWVASGTYYPTETTESTGGSMLYMSFKIPKGITVRGGFRGMVAKNAIGSQANKDLGADSVAYAGESKASDRYETKNDYLPVGYYYPYVTYLDGSISNQKTPKFTWDNSKHQYNTEFYGNSYHVVTFATEGFDENGRAKPLGTTAEITAASGALAKVEGVQIQHGNAYNSSTDGHPHNAYGGGVYMVPGSCLENSAVEQCEASRDGGGIYLDGGGIVRHCFVADCQALGVDLTTGYGGGVCVDENKQIFPPMMLRSCCINCVARYGGGLANKVNNTTYSVKVGSKTYDMRYNQGFSANVIAGCTALTEGGGVYALNGGSFTQHTIVRNACYGTGITVNGIKTGQSAGFYARNDAVLANSILWGGLISQQGEEKSPQFASSRSTTSNKAEIYYVAMNNTGYADFTGVKATNTIKLSRYNTAAAESAAHATSNSEEGYPVFFNPLETAGHKENSAYLHFLAYKAGDATDKGYSYKVAYSSACTNAGVPTADLDTEHKTPEQKGGTIDVFGSTFSISPTLGAYRASEAAMSADVEYTSDKVTYTDGTTQKTSVIPHIFVDSNSDSEATADIGSAWNKPIKNITDALNKIPSVITKSFKTYETLGYLVTKVVVHVKEGTYTVQASEATGTVRTSSINIPDLKVKRSDGTEYYIPIEIVGGYKTDITDNIYNETTNPTGKGQTSADFPARHGYADASVRNPILYHTIVTGYVMDGYAYTTPHIFKIKDVQNVTIDGLQVRYANAWSTELDNNVTVGGAFTINNATNVSLKNVLIAHCQGTNGPAIYETGNSNVSLENCIIHNNTVNVSATSVEDDNTDFSKGGIIYIESGSTMTLNHCDVLRNVGYPFYADGNITMDNSIVYANMTTALDNTNWNEGYAMDATFKGSGTVSCTYKDASGYGYNLFDVGSKNDTKAKAIAVGGVCNQKFDYQTNVENDYPAFVNPTNNSGVTEQGDKTFYGRATSFEPMNTNPCLNAASTQGVSHTGRTSDSSWGTDMSCNVNRDYGGLPDIGAVESHSTTKAELGSALEEYANADGQREYGSVLYVRDYRFSDGNISYNEGGDGSSWNTAINGNALYGSDGTIQTVTYTETTDEAGWKETSLSDYSNETGSTIKEDDSYVQKEGTVILKNGTKYLKLNGTSLTTTTDIAEASLFKFSGSGTSYTIQVYDESSSSYKDVGYNYTATSHTGYYWSGFSRRSFPYDTREYTLSVGSPDYTTWTVEDNRIYDTYTDYNSSHNYVTNFYYLNSSGGFGTTTSSNNSATTWNPYNRYYKSTSETTYTANNLSSLTGLNGLQYAVNKANTAFETKKAATWSTITPSEIEVGDIVSDNSDGSSSTIVQTYNIDTWQAKTTTVYTITPNEVWVGAGTYAKDNESGDQSCFMIRDGVNVYGAFPKIGNPCKDQRQALVSQYVKVISDYKYDNYETILEPITQTVASGATRRVLGQSYDNNPFKSGYTDYKGATWDGFTLRNGVLDETQISGLGSGDGGNGRNGGAGAVLYNNVTLSNCVITNNTAFAASDYQMRAGGVYMDGGTLKGCYLINNSLEYRSGTSASTNRGYAYGGGIYLYNGTVYNTVIANNKITANYADGAGMFVETACFFNNTIVNNYAQGYTRCSGGVTVYRDNAKSEEESSILHMTNCIIVNNSGNLNSGWSGQKQGTKDVSINNSGKIYLDNCITETQNSSSSDIVYNDATLLTTDFVSLFDNTSGIGSYGTDFTTLDLRLKEDSKAINAGIDQPTINGDFYDLTTYTDMDYEDRVQDCTIDIGAYEFNNAYSIRPDEASESGKAIYYVTPDGYGTASASDPENAACAAKLQKVIDAAGRYKYNLLNDGNTENDNIQVIVKVANSYSHLHPTSGDADNFTYYATRTTNINASSTDIDMRLWSIIVPRGVEVWGGYTDVAYSNKTTASWSNTDNGFYTRTGDEESYVYTDHRDILGNPTYFDAAYHNNVENSDVVGYHVVAFSDNVFDGSGNAYKSGDATKISTNQDASSSGNALALDETYGRGIVDGIFITGGKANANSTSSKSTNIYGGAALVNEYGHVRNCIIRDNEGDYGGGLAIAKGGLVSGCLVDQNTANKNGGGIYVLTDEENTNIGVTSTAMPYVYTSTIVNNTASVQGGGLFFDDKDNVRVNSTVIWQNHCSDMANIAGAYSPEKAANDETSTMEYFPVAYSAVQNLRVSGTNNISVANTNKGGVRFWKHNATKTVSGATVTDEDAMATDMSGFTDFGYYKLTNISALLRVGMPVTEYRVLETSKGLAANDFSDLSREAKADNDVLVRTYIDIGARALAKKELDNELMLRLFVAQPEDVDADAVTNFATLSDGLRGDNDYYSQQGSSFAYPFQSLQDALDYIYAKRGAILGSSTNGVTAPTDNANLLPFEICIAKGTYYPTEDLMGNYGQSFSNTFAIPEGVFLYGGFQINATDASGNTLSNTFYGRHDKAKSTNASELPVNYSTEQTDANNKTVDTSNPNYITANITPVNTGGATTNKTFATLYTIKEATTDELLSNRLRQDVNGNSIIEPWEFQNQTILSGGAVGDNTNGVFHVLTFVPDQNAVGVLPPKAVDFSTTYNAASEANQKYMNHEHGQYSLLNGLIITGGTAMNYFDDEDMDEYSKYNYYDGGGVLADGNRYCNDYGNWLRDGGTAPTTSTTTYMHTGVSDAVSYRDVIVTINQCKFLDNQAGYGGAICTNTTVDVYNSTFEENQAVYGVDKNVPITGGDPINVTYPGLGGAVFSTHQFAAYNTVFANNEAKSDLKTLNSAKYTTYRNQDQSSLTETMTGVGGVMYAGKKAQFHFINCDLVRNMANVLPCVATRNPNKFDATNEDAAELKTDGSYTINDYNQFLNTIAWGNELNAEMKKKFSSNTGYQFAGQLICNYAKPDGSHSGNFSSTDNIPQNQSDLDTYYAETAWFSAYENGRGKTCNNAVDIRDAQFRPATHCNLQIMQATGGTLQNCNIEIDSENSTLEGPNFSNPSKTAGNSGYNESADWSPARLNNMTDQGCGRMIQEITKKADETYDCVFPTYKTAKKDIDGNAIETAADSRTLTSFWGSAKVSGTKYTEEQVRSTYSNETTSSYITNGAYTTCYYFTPTNYAHTLPIGNDFYMKSLNGTTEQQMLYRVSYDPNPTHNATYIDIGVYEYPHTPLKYTTEGDEVDILWVSSEEKPDNGLPEGSAWTQPTSDLQRAIETLLSSRNGHRKEIRLMDGTYAPTYTIEGKLAFYFDTKYINNSVVLPVNSSNKPITGQGVKSFTIKGGYSKDLNEQYDVDLYPAIIRQKKQTGTSTDLWNHLFYVKDATQRYGSATDADVSLYNDANGYGWWKTTDEQSNKPAPTTIPIEIEGVSLVNNQAKASTNGAAIYYADQTFGDDCVQFDEDGVVLASGTSLDGYYTDAACTTAASGTANGTTKYYKKISYRATAPVSANVSVVDADGNKVVDTYESDGTTPATYKYAVKENPYKLILARSTVMNSGVASNDNAKITSAAYIGKFGGEALVYNSVFHSNRGDALDAYATKTINNTFALNSGKLVLNDKTGNSTYDTNHPYNSTIYNSAFWKNNSNGKQFNLVASSSKTYDGTVGDDGTIATDDKTTNIQSNAYTGGNTLAIDYTDAVISGNNYNVGLSDENGDAVYGPNFVDPAESATTDDAREARDFKLQPSLRLLNRGDNNTAHDAAMKTTPVSALYNTTEFTVAADKTFTTSWGDIYDFAWVTATNTDAASDARIVTSKNGVIDLGAYEYQAKQNRVLYVDPNATASGSGLSWASPFSYGNIQAAIDACAVYYKNEGKQTYVFVKGNTATNMGKHTNETITMRNGVAVYGSIHSDYLVDCNKTEEATGDYTYDDDVLNTYVKNLQILHREAVVSPTVGRTRILGINCNNMVFDETGKAVVDGFDVTAQTNASSDEMVAVKEPVININPKKSDTDYATGGLNMCLSNITVHGCDYSNPGSNQTNMNLVDINNALLYEALIYNNKVSTGGSALNVHDYGYAASVTVEGKTTGADGSTTLNNVASPVKCGKTTCTSANCPIHANTTASHVYNSITNYSGDAATWKTLSGYCYKMNHMDLNYQLTEKSPYIDAISVGTKDSKDQASVLGDMPSNLSQFINYWPVRSGSSWTSADRDLLGNFRLQTLGTVAGDVYNGNDYSSDGSTAYAPKLDRGAFETWDIKQSTKNCFPDFSHAGSVEYIRQGKSFIIDGIAEGGNNNPHNPGFVLMEMGSNLYGNGRRVEIPYIAVESYINKAYIKASPYYVMSAPFQMDYDNTTGIDSLTAVNATYGNSTSIKGIGFASYDANGGLIYTRPSISTYTYNGASRSATDFQFNDGKTSEHSSCWEATKSAVAAARGVHLEYNETPSVDGNIAYRVTAYSGTYETKVYTEEINFNNVHVYQSVPLYKYDDAESTDGAADFTDANDQGWNCIGLPYLVNKYYPYYKATFNPATTKVSILTPTDEGYSSATAYAMNNPHVMWLYYNGKVDADGNRLAPDGTSTTMGDGGFYAVNSWDTTADAWHMTSGKTPHIWMGEGIFVQNQKFSGDEELKFYIPVAPTLPINAISPSKSSNSSFASEDYCTRYYYDPDGINDLQADDDNDSDVVIKVIKHTLYVTNLKGGEDIRVFNTAGQLFKAATAESESYQTNVDPGVIIVTVNNKARKVFVK